MPVSAKFKFDEAALAYSKAFRLLKQLPGFDHRIMMRAEAGSILKAWAGRTKVAKKEEADLRARYRAGKVAFGALGGGDENNPYRITVNTGARGGVPGWVWYKHPGGGVMLAGYIDPETQVIHENPYRHFPNEAYAKIIAGMEAYADSLATLLPGARKAIGLSRQSVVQIADDLGIDLAAVKGGGLNAAGLAKARAAIASTGKRYKNGTGLQRGDQTSFKIRLTNTLPFCVKNGMGRELSGVLAGRAKFIQNAYKKGAFASIKGVVKAFPNMFQVKLSA